MSSKPRPALRGVRLYSAVGLAAAGLWLLLFSMFGMPEGGARPAALLVAEGDLGSRLLALCTAHSLTAAARLRLRIIWRSDQWLLGTKFGDLFDNLEFAVVDDLDASLDLGPGWLPWRQVAARASLSDTPPHWCRDLPVDAEVSSADVDQISGDLRLRQLAVPPGLYVANGTAPCRLWVLLQGCRLGRAVSGCLQQLSPSAEVLGMLVGVNETQLAASVGVLLQAGTPLEAAAACPATGAPRTRQRPSGKRGREEHGLAARRLLEAEAEAGAPPHAPARVSDGAAAVEQWVPERGYRDWSPHWAFQANVTVRALVAEVLRDPGVRFFAGGAPAQALQRVRLWLHRGREVQRLGFLTRGLRAICRGRGLEPGGGRPIFAPAAFAPNATDRLQLVACAQRQLAEFLVLSRTRTLVHAVPSGAAEFIMARAEADPELQFQRQVALRDGRHIPPLTRQKWAEQSYVNEERGVLYCSIPKVACTTWRLWMRRLQGLPELPRERLYHVHENDKNGLKVLALNFTERQAIQMVTRPGLFKFVVVRNPWSRILSAYLDKGKAGGAQHSPFNWNHALFGALHVPLPVQQYNRSRHPSFQEFLHLTGEMLAQLRPQMDEHIRPQGDLCSLATIKYELVGYLEAMEDATSQLTAMLEERNRGGSLPPLPAVGKTAHPTNSSENLGMHYTPELIERVGQVYASDLSFPLNSIAFAPPESLREMLSQRS